LGHKLDKKHWLLDKKVELDLEMRLKHLSSIFLGEAAPGFNLYSSILSQTPGTIFTDPGFALNVGSQYDTTQADILLGGAGISASQAAGQYSAASDQFNTALNLFGGIDFGKKD
jgi:hypothetical protein